MYIHTSQSCKCEAAPLKPLYIKCLVIESVWWRLSSTYVKFYTQDSKYLNGAWRLNSAESLSALSVGKSLLAVLWCLWGTQLRKNSTYWKCSPWGTTVIMLRASVLPHPANQTASPLTPRERCKTLADPWAEEFWASGDGPAEEHHTFRKLLLCICALWAWSGPPTDGDNADRALQQHHEESVTTSWAEGWEILDVGSELEGQVVLRVVCPWGCPALKQRPRSMFWKAFLNSRLKHG